MNLQRQAQHDPACADCTRIAPGRKDAFKVGIGQARDHRGRHDPHLPPRLRQPLDRAQAAFGQVAGSGQSPPAVTIAYGACVATLVPICFDADNDDAGCQVYQATVVAEAHMEIWWDDCPVGTTFVAQGDAELLRQAPARQAGLDLPASRIREVRPNDMVTLAVRRMLPKNRLGHRMLKNLTVYPTAEHPHSAQQPVIVEEL